MIYIVFAKKNHILALFARFAASTSKTLLHSPIVLFDGLSEYAISFHRGCRKGPEHSINSRKTAVFHAYFAYLRGDVREGKGL